jgi:hypothetical protein
MEPLTVIIAASVPALGTVAAAVIWGGPRFLATVMCLISARKDPTVYGRDLQTLRSVTSKETPAE